MCRPCRWYHSRVASLCQVWSLWLQGFSNRRTRARGTCADKTGSYLRLIDSCITHLKAQRPSRTCNESKEEEPAPTQTPAFTRYFFFFLFTLVTSPRSLSLKRSDTRVYAPQTRARYGHHLCHFKDAWFGQDQLEVWFTIEKR